MKTALKALLIIIFIPLFFTGIILGNIKYQIFNKDFWLTTFEENKVYESLATSFKKSSEAKIKDEGTNLKDAEVLTNLITPENFKDITTRNTVNLIDFINGKTQKLEVYIPITKLPKELLPTNFGSKPDTIPIAQLLKSFNVTNVSESQINMLSQFGFWTTLAFYADIFLLALILFLFFILTDMGKRFWSPGLAFFWSGIIVIILYVFGEAVRQNMLQEWTQSSEPLRMTLSTFSPFIIEKLTRIWLISGLSAIVLGILLFFIKRPMYNTQR